MQWKKSCAVWIFISGCLKSPSDNNEISNWKETLLNTLNQIMAHIQTHRQTSMHTCIQTWIYVNKNCLCSMNIIQFLHNNEIFTQFMYTRLWNFFLWQVCLGYFFLIVFFFSSFFIPCLCVEGEFFFLSFSTFAKFAKHLIKEFADLMHNQWRNPMPLHSMLNQIVHNLLGIELTS